MRLLAAGISLLLAMAGGLTAQTSPKTTTLTDADHAIEGLRQVVRDLSDAVRRFHSDLDEAIDRYDRGYRAADGPQIRRAEDYREIDRYSLWRLEPGDDSRQPSQDDMEAALADVEDARVAIRMAVDDFWNTIRAIAREQVLDAGLARSAKDGHSGDCGPSHGRANRHRRKDEVLSRRNRRPAGERLRRALRRRSSGGPDRLARPAAYLVVECESSQASPCGFFGTSIAKVFVRTIPVHGTPNRDQRSEMSASRSGDISRCANCITK